MSEESKTIQLNITLPGTVADVIIKTLESLAGGREHIGQPTNHTPALFSTREAAEYLRYSYSHFSRQYADEIEHTRRNGKRFYTVQALDQWLLKHLTAGSAHGVAAA